MELNWTKRIIEELTNDDLKLKWRTEKSMNCYHLVYLHSDKVATIRKTTKGYIIDSGESFCRLIDAKRGALSNLKNRFAAMFEELDCRLQNGRIDPYFPVTGVEKSVIDTVLTRHITRLLIDGIAPYKAHIKKFRDAGNRFGNAVLAFDMADVMYSLLEVGTTFQWISQGKYKINAQSLGFGISANRRDDRQYWPSDSLFGENGTLFIHITRLDCQTLKNSVRDAITKVLNHAGVPAEIQMIV